MEKLLQQFKQVAPLIAGNVKARLTGTESEEQTMAIVHEEILKHFTNVQNMFIQYLTFNADQRRQFAGIMYDLLAPLAERKQLSTNKIYEAFVQKTGKSGALNFICHQLSSSES